MATHESKEKDNIYFWQPNNTQLITSSTKHHIQLKRSSELTLQQNGSILILNFSLFSSLFLQILQFFICSLLFLSNLWLNPFHFCSARRNISGLEMGHGSPIKHFIYHYILKNIILFFLLI